MPQNIPKPNKILWTRPKTVMYLKYYYTSKEYFIFGFPQITEQNFNKLFFLNAHFNKITFCMYIKILFNSKQLLRQYSKIQININ